MLLLTLVAAWIASFALRGEVVAPHLNGLELGIQEEAAGPSSRRHSDYSNFYAPEIALHAEAFRRGELALWNPHVQLGRPASHLAGVSPAYPPMAACLAATSDPHVAHTLLWCLTLLGIALFAWAWFAELGLRPEARLVGALLAAFSPFVAYWAPLLLFASTICWTLAVLWLAERLARRPTAWSWLGLACAVWLLLVSGYPQQIVWHLLVVLVALAPGLVRAERPAALAAAWIGAALAGLALASPVLLDTALAAERSARDQLEREFYLQALPGLSEGFDALRQCLQLFDPRLGGDPWSVGSGPRFDGVAFGAVGLALLWYGFHARGGRRWAWLALSLGLLTWVPALFEPLLELRLFTLSRFVPAAAAVVPVAAAAAWAAHHLGSGAWRGRALLALVPVSAAVALCLWAFAAGHAHRLEEGQAWRTFFAAGCVALVAWQQSRPRPQLLACAAAAAAFVVARPLLLTQPRERIVADSPLVEALRKELRPGERYAVASGRDVRLLPPNQETLLGLSSVHSYDSLSSREYQAWCASLSGKGAETAGRWFRRFDDPARIDARALAQAGVGVVLSNLPLPADEFEHVRDLGEFALWRTRRTAWTPGLVAVATRDGIDAGLAEDARPSAASRRGEAEAWDWSPQPRAAMFHAARQYHPQWRASALVGDERIELEPSRLDVLYLGFEVPPGTRGIELRFEPHARHAWQAPLLVALAALALCVRYFLRRRNSSDAGRP